MHTQRPKIILALLCALLCVCATGWRPTAANAAIPSRPEEQQLLADHLVILLWGSGSDDTSENEKTVEPSCPSKQSKLRTKLEMIGRGLFGDRFADHVYQSNEQLIRACFAGCYGEESSEEVIEKVLATQKTKRL